MRIVLRVMQVGAIAVVLAATTLNVFELDRFFVPKELVLHATALIAGILALHRITITRVDRLLMVYMLTIALSAAFATNRWLALRAVAISASGILLFWSARALRDAGLARPLLGTLALAIVIAALTALAQAYGIDLAFFSENRAPGGTFGNRNFVAHIAAFGLPLLLLAALRAQKFWLGAIGTALVTATLVLTRSRAAWLAFGVVLFVMLVALLIAQPLRRDARIWRRLAAIALLCGCGVAAALVTPNALRWRSRNPYLETLERVAEYREGSGRGRLVQYEQSLRMAAHHPIFGVGPGNWAVEYPKHAVRNDPSMSDSDAGMTFNPWPSSDWIASVAERGLFATVMLALALIGIALGAFRQLVAARDAEESLDAMTLIATLIGVVVVGMFDAVLLLAAPTFLVWPALGALWTPPQSTSRQPLKYAFVILAAIGTARSAAQIIAMQTYATHSDRASLERASRIDPGNYRLQLRLARMGPRKLRCEHARAAHALYPHAKPGVSCY
ncbi:MAG TPA: O-antigen ligase family protein [Thermoanaerobaculia bacterium]|nr:O-antigen ligase family protein [Thermoanaerobaculia bacterium]